VACQGAARRFVRFGHISLNIDRPAPPLLEELKSMATVAV
jgi:hypothetical protein